MRDAKPPRMTLARAKLWLQQAEEELRVEQRRHKPDPWRIRITQASIGDARNTIARLTRAGRR